MTFRLGGRGLLLQRLRRARASRLHLLEQPHVLDGDHRLVGEGLDQLDLPFGERLPSPVARAIRRSARRRAAAERRGGCETAICWVTVAKRIFGIGLDIRNVLDRAVSASRGRRRCRPGAIGKSWGCSSAASGGRP